MDENITLDEFLIACGDVVPLGGGEYVLEERRIGAMRLMSPVTPQLAYWPEGVTPTGYERSDPFNVRALDLSPEYQARCRALAQAHARDRR